MRFGTTGHMSSRASFAAALRRVVTQPSFRVTAQRLGEQIGCDAAEQRAVTGLKGLAMGKVGRRSRTPRM